MADLAVLDVLLHGRAIGTLTRLPGDRNLFAFHRTYIEDAERPTLSLSFKDSLGQLITDLPPTQTRLPPFFANLLPEGPLRDYLARRAGVKPQREFFLLWVLGCDLPGALEVKSADGETLHPDVASDADGRRNQAFRFSLAGVQLKFSAIMQAHGGLTIPAEGIGGSWIVKLPSLRFDGVPENEFAMMTLARASGIDIPEIQLVPLDDIAGLPTDLGALRGSALAVKRFDRDGDGGTVHIEDFAQVFGVYPEEKYGRAGYRNVAEVIWAEIGEKGIAEFIRRLVFSVLIGNADLHLKNWSLTYPDRRRAALAPAYDFVSTIAYLDDRDMALTIGRSKKMWDLTTDELSYLAAKARLPEKLVLNAAKDTVNRFRQTWADRRSDLPLAARVLDVVDSHLRNVPLAKG